MDHPYSVPGLSDLANPLAPTARATSNLEVALTENRSAVALRLHVIQRGGDIRETFVLSPSLAKQLSRLLEAAVDDYLSPPGVTDS